MSHRRSDTARIAAVGGARATIAREGDDLASVPALGPRLAERIADQLHIESFEDLEAAAHDGRLQAIAGIGPGRARAISEYLELMLSPAHPHPHAGAAAQAPPVELILELDADYRHLAQDGRLPRVAPRRFNPEHKAWLPVWHAMRDGWLFTVMYSNSARAHDLGKLRDWVVVLYKSDDGEGEATVVTEYRGAMQGRRIVRGRERECRAHHDEHRVAGDVRAWAQLMAERLDRDG